MADKKYYIVRLEYVADILEKRGPFRAEHLANAQKLKEEGLIVMGGAMVDPCDAGVFVFLTSDKADIDKFIANDPYCKNKLVSSTSIREWMVVV